MQAIPANAHDWGVLRVCHTSKRNKVKGCPLLAQSHAGAKIVIVLTFLWDYTIFLRNLHFFFCTCHNFFPLSSVQIIIIPACCLLCVLKDVCKKSL